MQIFSFSTLLVEWFLPEKFAELIADGGRLGFEDNTAPLTHFFVVLITGSANTSVYLLCCNYLFQAFIVTADSRPEIRAVLLSQKAAKSSCF